MSHYELDTMLVEELREDFLRQYYHDEILELVRDYADRTILYVDWMDLYRFDDDPASEDDSLAEQFLTKPEPVLKHLTAALREYDIPIDVPFDRAKVRVVGLNDADVYSPLELKEEHSGNYIGVKGEIAQATNPVEKIKIASFECQRCGTDTRVPQEGTEWQEPHECKGCERQGPFQIDYDESEFVNYCKLQIKTPPDQRSGNAQGQIDAEVEGELVYEGDEHVGLVARAGEKAIVYGVVERAQRKGQNANEQLFERYLDVHGVEFVEDEDDVNIKEHKEEFKRLADRDDAVDLFAESLAPELHATDEWEAALQLGVAYLFGAPRIDVPQGPTFRGDIHAMILSDYGMGKSTYNEAIKEFSPHAIKKSVTGISSDVGLLAAAVKDDFGDGQWTIKPGVLVRGNGGHVILDEIDKTDADLARMNDALEGEQMVDIDKAGQSVTYESRVGLLATGNPMNGRFNQHEPIADQLGIKQSLLSRFDGIITMRDTPNRSDDKAIAETQGKAYIEAQQAEHGQRDEFDMLDRDVSVDVGRAWIAYARENVNPMLKWDQFEQIREWYAEEVRTLNETFREDEGEGMDMPVPATARVVEATIRFSVAFARVHLRDEVADADVERAMNLSKTLVGQNFDGEKFTPQQVRGGEYEQAEPKVKSVLNDARKPMDVSEVAEAAGVEESKAEHALDKLSQKGKIYKRKGQWESID